MAIATWFSGDLAPLDAVEFDDPALSTRQAGMEIWLDIPIFSSFGQF
jgi:hypothetical protein